MLTKEQLHLKLSEVAEFKMPELTKTALKAAKQKGRGAGRPSAEERYQDEHEEVFLDMFEGINPTHRPELVKVHIKPQDCEDCGKHLTESREMHIKFYKETAAGHVAHWRKHCKNCNKYRDPNTGLFTLSQGPACQVYLNWAKSEFSARKKAAKKQSDK
jgi:hypothetical protein